jgi:hypothetical protein
MKALYDYVKFILTQNDAAQLAHQLGFSTLPDVVAANALVELDSMECTDRCAAVTTSHPCLPRGPLRTRSPSAVCMKGGRPPLRDAELSQ